MLQISMQTLIRILQMVLIGHSQKLGEYYGIGNTSYDYLCHTAI